VLEALAKRTAGDLKSFFAAHDLGFEFENDRNRFDTKSKKIADAVVAAERRDRGEYVLLDAVETFDLGHLIAAYVAPGLPELVDAVQQRADWGNVQRALTAAAAEAYTNPAGAITASRSTIESVCKHICGERSVAYSDSDTLPVLFKKTVRALSLSPDQQGNAAVRQTLQGAVTVVDGLAAVRNSFGDAHGKGKGVPGTPEAYGALAVNMATGVTRLLLDTHRQ
jgi:Abortive infection C-terminus